MRKYKSVYEMLELVVKTILKSVEPLCVMVGIIVLAMVFYGSIIFMLEAGTFQVTPDYPQGEVMTHNAGALCVCACVYATY